MGHLVLCGEHINPRTQLTVRRAHLRDHPPEIRVLERVEVRPVVGQVR